MPLLKAILLGIVEGLTEFLPVSSSAHRALLQNLLGLKSPGTGFDIAVHAALLFAILIYFRKDLGAMIHETFLYLAEFARSKNRGELADKYPYALLSGFVIFATVPTAIIGFVFKDFVENLFVSFFPVSIAWIVMGIILVVSKNFANGRRPLNLMSHRDAFVIGVAQGIAFMPGMSRSGAAILAGVGCEIEPKDAARFSFMLAIPAILGASVLEWKQPIDSFDPASGLLPAGFIAAFISGYLALVWLMRAIENKKFHHFGYYCLALGIFSLSYSLLHR